MDRAALVERYIKVKSEHDRIEQRLRGIKKMKEEKREALLKTEEFLKAVQSVGLYVGDIINAQTDDRYLVKISSGSRSVVGVRPTIPKNELKTGTRVTLDITSLTIMKPLKREVDPTVYKMLTEDPGDVPYESIGGLNEQMSLLREAVELPITNPDIFKRIGIKAPKGVLLYGPPGTGKTLLARALAHNVSAKFMKVVASSIMEKYIGESARLIREMFTYAKNNQPCIIFIDEIDAIGGRRLSEGNSSDREIQRTLMELLSQMDGFDSVGQVKIVMATNRPDVLDPALLRPGRLDRKIEIPLPNEVSRADILRIHAKPITKAGNINYDGIAKICDDFNGADLRNICTEAGMFALRADRESVIEEDFYQAARKIKEAKKLETKMEYAKV